jgi:periplasmic protein TonB
MNTITFDGGVKRQFVLPVAIVLSAHVALFLGFMSRPVALHLNPPHRHETDSKLIDVPLIDETTVQKNDDQLHDTSAQEQPRKTPYPIPLDPPHIHEIVITPEIPIVSPVTGPWLPGNPGKPISPGRPPVSPDVLDRAPEAVRQPQPVYPIDAKNTGESGGVVVAFVVDESGRVLNPHVVSSTDPIFEEPTLSAIGQWRFVPGTWHGRPVRFRMTVPVAFHLDR